MPADLAAPLTSAPASSSPSSSLPSSLSDAAVREAALALWQAHPELTALAPHLDAETFAARKLALYRSVDTLSVSDSLKSAWREAALTDPALRLPSFFVRCVDVGFATNPTSLRRGFREPDNSDEDLLFLFRLLGRYQLDAARMVLDAEWDALAEDERDAVSARAIEVFLDIYPFLRDEQKRIADRLEHVCALAGAEAENLRENGGDAEETASLMFAQRLIKAGLSW